MRLLGLDPGLLKTGWGVIDADGVRIGYIACGTIRTDPADDVATRLSTIYNQLEAVIETQRPVSAAVEETFVNRNPSSALKLGLARGVVLMAPARAGLPVVEYHNRRVKKAVVGAGQATKRQIELMVRHLLPTSRPDSEDASDALAVAICHAHCTGTENRWRAAEMEAEA